MDPKQIKAALKEARELIKNKDFTNSIKLCKNVLKSDKQNYMALVLCGVCLQEIGPQDQAPNAFKKAIQISPELPLAWNGLASYYEKDESKEASQELVTIYEKLLHMESETHKFSDLIEKLVQRVVQIPDVPKGASILKELVNNNLSDTNRHKVWLALASLLAQTSNLTPDLLELYELTLSSVVKERHTVTCDYYREYLKLLYKLNKYELLFTEAVNMHLLYESNVYPLEWICKIFVESLIEGNSMVNIFENQINEYVQKLLKLQENSVMGTFVEGVMLYKTGNVIDARDKLKTVVSMRSGLTHAWVLLSECLLKLCCYNDILQTGPKAKKLLDASSKESVHLQNKIDRIYLQALAHLEDNEKLNEAIEIGKKILEQNQEDTDVLESIVIAQIKLSKYDDAEKSIELLRKKNTNSFICTLMQAKLWRKQGDARKALNALKEVNAESSDLYLEIGTLHWDLQEYELSLVPFLKAAKLDSNNSMCFVHLGCFYEHFNDIDKARRCYQKAFKINPKSIKAGVGLSKIYRQQQNWSASLELLQSITGANNSDGLPVISTDIRWAWLQLGLHYLDQGEYSSAINTFRSILRIEPNNGHYWECLADAYRARGAYIAALKSYEQAVELLDDKLYSKLQVATIKLMLGRYAEARLKFEELLAEDKRYVLALKGLAENCLNLAFFQRKDQLLGLCRANAQLALDQLTIALKEKGNLSCLWKLAGDSCSLVASLSEKYCNMTVQTILAEGRESEELVILNKSELYLLAARCYCKAISLNEDNMLLWHDLAMCYFSHGQSTSDIKQKEKLLKHALATIKYCIANNSGCWNHWNLLGVIAAHEDVRNYSLAQHAFIKAITLEHHSAVAWSNLGALYFLVGDVRLANKAFSQGQCSDATYVNSWIGQAIIAESIGNEEAMDLFRHSTQICYHPQGSLGYANWVLRTIIKAPAHSVIYSIHNMYAIPLACDALTWYTANNSFDVCAWNMFGLLQERLGLYKSALHSFKEALRLVDDENLDKVLINTGRMFMNLKQYQRAVELFKNVKEASFNSGCGLALALFKDKCYEESYEQYHTTMQWLAENENLQSHVLVALAAMTYMFKGPDDAKTLLFESTQLKPPSKQGLYATLALGLLHGDLPLAQLVLKELLPMKDKADVIYHYAVLLSLTYLLKGDKISAIRLLTKSVHRHPLEASLWYFLSILLLQISPNSKSRAAAKCAQVAMKLGRSQMDVTKVLCVVSLATFLSKDSKEALAAAQRAVHYYPNIAEGWATLISALSLKNSVKNNWQRQNEWIQTAKRHVKNFLSPSKILLKWLNK